MEALKAAEAAETEIHIPAFLRVTEMYSSSSV